MRSSLKSLIAIAAAVLVVPSFASADDMGGGDDMQEVLSRMSDLEQQLRATNDSLAAANARVDQQQKMLSKMGTGKPGGAMPALSEFLTETNFGGWVSASYFYNLNNPDSADTAGANLGNSDRGSLANAFHGNSNSFQVDEVWFEISNDATPESRGGFQIDVLMGQTADVMCGDFDSDDDGDDKDDRDRNGGSEPCLYTANVSYLAPITDAGIEITAGRFATAIGAERPGAPYNFNITRGLVWNMQPINHTGVKAASTYDNGLDWMLGVSNTSGYEGSQSAQNTDLDDEKVFLWRLGYKASDTTSIAFSGLWGGDCALSAGASDCADLGHDEDKQGVVDMVLDWNPSDRLSTWLDVMYVWTNNEDRNGDPSALGIAAAGRYAITDATGFALRAEYVRAWDDYLEITPTSSVDADKDDHDLWSVTGTIDHQLTDHLSVKAEAVYQQGNSKKTTESQFFQDDDSSDYDNEQVLVGVQMTYRF
jgi:hypothetical protein